MHPSELPSAVPTDCQEDAPISCDTRRHDGHTGVAAAVGLWERSKKLAGQVVTEVAVATVVLPVVLPSLAVLHVPAGMWAGACLGRAAYRNLLGF